MAFTSDVKSTRLAASGAIFGGRSRVKGLYIVPGGSAGSVVIKDGGSSGTTVATIDTVANGTTVYIHLPEDGLLCTTSSYATLTNVTAITAFYA
jgi:hypothetical protein